jgi:hypothetical protein
MKAMIIMVSPNGFKIRRKSDVDVFINQCMLKDNEYYIVTDDGFQFVFRKDKEGNVSVLNRNGDLRDIFSPLLEVARTNNNCYEKTVVDYIWQNRKYINAKWFSDKEN